eukprot:scaffold16625_cov118-Cylindrotheca_fusiformis.AAC.5
MRTRRFCSFLDSSGTDRGLNSCHFRSTDPKKSPFLPHDLVGPVSNFAFHALELPLVYSTIAMTVTIESIGDYWFVIVGAFLVLGVSYSVATLMQRLIPISNLQDFRALRISVTFPNIVSLPILIFPSLCEFPVVHEGYMVLHDDEGEFNRQELEDQCRTQANTMIFCYCFSYMFLFWGIGYPQLMNAAHRALATTNNDETKLSQQEESKPILHADDRENRMSNTGQQICEQRNNNILQDQGEEVVENEGNTALKNIYNALKQTFSSPGFVATILGFITACIPPLQKALFEPEEPLRFLGSAVETLGVASTSMLTMIAAASLVPQQKPENVEQNENADNQTAEAGEAQSGVDRHSLADPGPTIPNRFLRIRSIWASIRSNSTRIVKSVTRSAPEVRRLHLWFCLSRLVVSPAVVVGIIVAVECGSNLLQSVPRLSLLVIIINSCLPGAFLVVVLLKSKTVLEDTAAAVAKAYFLSYMICIFTIAAWTALGLWITLPDEDGNTVCRR